MDTCLLTCLYSWGINTSAAGRKAGVCVCLRRRALQVSQGMDFFLSVSFIPSRYSFRFIVHSFLHLLLFGPVTLHISYFLRAFSSWRPILETLRSYIAFCWVSVRVGVCGEGGAVEGGCRRGAVACFSPSPSPPLARPSHLYSLPFSDLSTHKRLTCHPHQYSFYCPIFLPSPATSCIFQAINVLMLSLPSSSFLPDDTFFLPGRNNQHLNAYLYFYSSVASSSSCLLWKHLRLSHVLFSFLCLVSSSLPSWDETQILCCFLFLHYFSFPSFRCI